MSVTWKQGTTQANNSPRAHPNVPSISIERCQGLPNMEEEDDNFYEPGDSVPAVQPQNDADKPPSDVKPQETAEVEEEEEVEEDEVRLWDAL